MKFTKENIETVISEWFWKDEDSHLDELFEKLRELDDTPEKVVVPKFVADYLEDCKKRNIKLVSALCPFKMGYGKEIELWFDNEDNNRLFALAWINGYEVEKESLYHVVNKDGGLMLFNNCDGVVGATPSPASLTIDKYGHKPYYQLTEKEIKDHDERYWPFSVLVND